MPYRPFGEAPVDLAQEVRASPPSPSQANLPPSAPSAEQLARRMPVRAAPRTPPRVVNRGTFQKVPVQAILQGGGMNGLGAPPKRVDEVTVFTDPQCIAGGWAQPGSGAVISRTAIVGRNPCFLPQAKRNCPSGTVFALLLDAEGKPIQRCIVPEKGSLPAGRPTILSGAPIQATNINGAPVMVDSLDRPGSLAAVHMDTSVSAQVRGAKALGALRADGVQVSGDYTDAIRNAAGFAFGPKRMPRQGFAAASYSYPAKQMVVGSTLSGQPIVNPMPTRGASPAAAPKLVTRGGIRGQISSSPSEDRRRLISTLMGLGASEFKEDSTHIYADSDWFKNTPAGSTRPTYMGVSCYRSVSADANANQTFATSCTLSAAAAAAWAKWADDTFGGPTGNAEYRRIAKLVPEVAPAPPWSVAGRLQRGLPQDWESVAKAVKGEAEKRAAAAKAAAEQAAANAAAAAKAEAEKRAGAVQQQAQMQTGTFRPAIITRPPTTSTMTNQILANTAASGQVSLPPQMASTLPTLPPVVRPPALPAIPQAPLAPVAAGGSNTVMLVGGALALAAVAFIATRK